MMSPTRDEIDEDKARRRLNRRERKARQVMRNRVMLTMRDEGFSTKEIAESLGVTANRVGALAQRTLGIRINHVGGRRRIAAWATPETVAAFRSIAERAGKPLPDIMSRLLAILAENEGRHIIRLMGKDLTPKKTRAKKEAEVAGEPTKRQRQREAREAKAETEKARAEREKAAIAAMKRRIGS